jgi:hypothetical protein
MTLELLRIGDFNQGIDGKFNGVREVIAVFHWEDQIQNSQQYG